MARNMGIIVGKEWRCRTLANEQPSSALIGWIPTAYLPEKLSNAESFWKRARSLHAVVHSEHNVCNQLLEEPFNVAAKKD
jgi:hypothetical protein